jgi:hypothetical protein
VLDAYYERFLAEILRASHFPLAAWREFAGQRFLYVSSPLNENEVTSHLIEQGTALVEGTKLQIECVYVRSVDNLHVYRFRFTVPNEKQFCCGNQCEDCTLLRIHR